MLEVRQRLENGAHLFWTQDQRKLASGPLVGNPLDVPVLLERDPIEEAKSGNGLVEDAPGHLSISGQVELVLVDILDRQLVWRAHEDSQRSP